MRKYYTIAERTTAWKCATCGHLSTAHKQPKAHRKRYSGVPADKQPPHQTVLEHTPSPYASPNKPTFTWIVECGPFVAVGADLNEPGPHLEPVIEPVANLHTQITRWNNQHTNESVSDSLYRAMDVRARNNYTRADCCRECYRIESGSPPAPRGPKVHRTTWPCPTALILDDILTAQPEGEPA